MNSAKMRLMKVNRMSALMAMPVNSLQMVTKNILYSQVLFDDFDFRISSHSRLRERRKNYRGHL